MGWAERTKEGQKRVSHRDTRVPLIDRPGIVAVVSGDRTTYPQFAGCAHRRVRPLPFCLPQKRDCPR